MAMQVNEKFPVVIGREFTPHIASIIFNLLDKKELTKSRSVSSMWKDVVDSKTNLWTDPELYGKAAKEGNLDFCQMIIKKVDNKNPPLRNLSHISAPIWSGYCTPLNTAATEGHVEICRLILDHLEDKNPKNQDGATPLHFAATAAGKPGSAEVYRLIMNEVDDKNPKDNDGFTPLHCAAMLGNFEVSKLIVENVDEKNPAAIDDGSTPLHEAARHGYADIFCLIFGKVEDKNPPDLTGNTPLHYAASNDFLSGGLRRQSYVDICRLILANVDNKHPVNHHGETPLDAARERFEEWDKDIFQELKQLWLQEENQ